MPQPFVRANYSGYLVLDRVGLLAALAAAGLPPAHERVVAEHVTYAYPDPDCAPPVSAVTVVGHVCAAGVQALLVAVDGATRRPDGRRFHLTYSLAAGRVPVQSLELLATVAVRPLAPIPVPVRPF